MRYSHLIAAITCLAASVLAACGGGQADPSSGASSAPTCPPPPTIPTPVPAWLDYPPNGTANVSVNVGAVIEKGVQEPGQTGLAITVTTALGASVPLGAATSAPSPLPSPFATPPPTYPITGPYVAIPLPTLSPNTVYNIADTYSGWANNPPQCSTQYSQPVGSFTTGQ